MTVIQQSERQLHSIQSVSQVTVTGSQRDSHKAVSETATVQSVRLSCSGRWASKIAVSNPSTSHEMNSHTAVTGTDARQREKQPQYSQRDCHTAARETAMQLSERQPHSIKSDRHVQYVRQPHNC